MKNMLLVLPLAALAAACATDLNPAEGAASNRVQTSGKIEVPVADLPEAVLAAARQAEPGFKPAEAERETREGRHYFDVGGTLADGSEVEFDIMEEGGQWRVVETQRDIAFGSAPALVQSTARTADPNFVPVRVIESRQNDGIVIYELFGPAVNGGEPRKVEIRYDGSKAELLTKEWAH